MINIALIFLGFLCIIPPLSYIAFFVLLPMSIFKYRSRLFTGNKYALILVGTVVLSVLFSVNKLLSLGAMLVFCCYVFSYFVFSKLKINEKKLFDIILLAGIVVVGAGVIFYLSNTQIVFKNRFINFRFLPDTSFLGNANRFVQYLILTIPFGLSFLLFSGGKRDKIAVSIFLLLALVSVFITKSLMGVIAVFVIVLGVLCYKNKWAALIIFIVGIGAGVIKRHQLADFTLVYCTRQRLYTDIHLVPAIVKHNPITGCGIGAYREGALKYTTEKLDSGRMGLYYHAHNMYLHYLAETGILGLLSYLLFLGMFLYRGLLYLKKEVNWFILGGFFSVIGLLIDGFSENCIGYLPIGIFFFCIIGMVEGVLQGNYQN